MVDSNLEDNYQITLKIKQGVLGLPYISKLLIDWINKEFDVNAVNIVFDKIIPDERPRINIVFEYGSDILKFRENGIGNYLKENQLKIANKYVELVKQLNLENCFSIDNVFVCYSEFSSIYKSNLYKNIPKSLIDKLFNKYKNDKIWEIKIYGSGLIVFFTTNLEKENLYNNIIIESLKDDFYSILKPFDEFDYLKEIFIKKDSKEDFIKIYKSNWFYWSRDN